MIYVSQVLNTNQVWGKDWACRFFRYCIWM